MNPAMPPLLDAPPPMPGVYVVVAVVPYRAPCPGCSREVWWAGAREYNEFLGADRAVVSVDCSRCTGGGG